jgi:hypothetical protein
VDVFLCLRYQKTQFSPFSEREKEAWGEPYPEHRNGRYLIPSATSAASSIPRLRTGSFVSSSCPDFTLSVATGFSIGQSQPIVNYFLYISLLNFIINISYNCCFNYFSITGVGRIFQLGWVRLEGRISPSVPTLDR